MFIAVALFALLTASWAAAQGSGTVTVQVVDPSGAGIPHAVVVLKNDAGAVDATVDVTGRATLSAAPGSYELIASAEGFGTGTQTVRLTAGRTRRLQMELPLSKVLETVTVVPDVRSAAETSIGAEQIDALAEDPEALEEFIRDIGGPEATVTVDGFEGGRIPPKDQVAQLIVTSDPYSAQFHEVGSSRVDVVTKPGFGNWEGRANVNFSSDSLGARNPFAREKLPYQNLNGRFSVSGPLKRLRTSISLDGNIRQRDETRPLIATTPAGLVRNDAESRDNIHSFELRTTHTIGVRGVLRNRLEWERGESTGSGLGDIDLPERAFTGLERELTVRSNLTNQLPRGVRQDLRLSLEWASERQQAVTEARAIDVLGAFRAGGAQVSGEVASRTLEGAAEWILPARGRHTISAGLRLDQERYDSSSLRNYLGTFVFAGLDAYLAGTPTTFTQRVGSTDVAFTDTRIGIFLQDDIRLTQALSLGVGVRQEFQPVIDAMLNVAPRLSFAWTGKTRTIVRFGLGAFYDWHDASLLEEAQRLEGDESYELVISNPGYPEPATDGGAVTPLPPTRLVTADDLRIARVWRGSMTVEKRLGRAVNVRSTIYRQVGRAEPRARNINAPIDGARPDPASGNILLLAPSGRSRRTSAETNVTFNGLWNRRLFGHVQYSFGEILNDADGPLSLPADSLHPEREWGPARQDIRHRGFVALTFRIPNSLSVGFTNRFQSAAPYNITSGRDTNGDTISNDRPAGVGRNAARAQGFWITDVHIGWSRAVTSAHGQRGPSRGGGPEGASERRRPQVGFNITARNVFNRPQYGGFNGVITSPFFGQPVSATNPRRVDVGVSFSF
jgi:hypothetical protein